MLEKDNIDCRECKESKIVKICEYEISSFSYKCKLTDSVIDYLTNPINCPKRDKEEYF